MRDERFVCALRALDPAEGQLDKVQTRWCGIICARGQQIWTGAFEGYRSAGTSPRVLARPSQHRVPSDVKGIHACVVNSTQITEQCNTGQSRSGLKSKGRPEGGSLMCLLFSLREGLAE